MIDASSKKQMTIRAFFTILFFFLMLTPAQAETEEKLALLGHRALDAWRLDEAGLIAEKLFEQDASSVKANFFLGRYYFRLGDYTKALDYVNGARDYRGKDMNLYDYTPRLESVYHSTKDFKKATSEHFEFRYADGKDAVLVAPGLETMEKTYAALAEDLGFRPKHKVIVEIYPRLEDLAGATGLTIENLKTSGVIAICKYNRLMVTTPRVSPLGYAWRDTLNHEYVHLAISTVSRNHTPVWLHEALAKFHEERWRKNRGGQLEESSESLLARALREDKLVSLDEISPSMAYLPSQEHTALAFAQVLTMAQYLFDLKGQEGIQNLLLALAEDADLDNAFLKVYGFDVKGFERKWRQTMRRKRLKELDYHFDDYSILFNEDVSEEERLFEAMKKKRGKSFITLGKLLKDRQHHKAAVKEFEKAKKEIGDRHPMLQNLIAASQLKAGQYEKVVQSLEPVMQSAPNYLPSYVRMGQAHVEKGEYESALNYLEYAIGINPFDPRVQALLVKCYQELGETEKAEKAEADLRKIGF